MAGLESIEFARNPEPRCPCVLLVDVSGSMDGQRILELNHGLQVFKDSIVKDAVAARRVEVAIVTFDSTVTVVQDFVTADKFNPPTLTTGGYTHMGSGILKALEILKSRKAQYNANGVTYYRPWVFMITDGEPQGEPDAIVKQAANRLNDDEKNKRVAFFAVGVEDANMERLQEIVVRQPVKLKGLNFAEMFEWLSRSLQGVSQANTDAQVALQPVGWGTID